MTKSLLGTLLDPASLPRAASPRQRPKSSRQRLCREPATWLSAKSSRQRSSRQRILCREPLGRPSASSRQRLCRGPETSSAKPTAPARNVEVDVVFVESRVDRLSAKTFYKIRRARNRNITVINGTVHIKKKKFFVFCEFECVHVFHPLGDF